MGVGGLQVHGICGCRMVHKEVVETLYTMRNLTCGDWTGSKWTDQTHVSPRPVLRKSGRKSSLV